VRACSWYERERGSPEPAATSPAARERMGAANELAGILDHAGHRSTARPAAAVWRAVPAGLRAGHSRPGVRVDPDLADARCGAQPRRPECARRPERARRPAATAAARE